MINQWEGKNKKKFYLIIAFLLVLIISGGTYAYTYTTAVGTINIAAPTGDIATSNATATQPDWNSVLSANTTCGDVPTGNIFSINPNPAYTGDLLANIHLANVGSLIKAYQYLNMQVYVASSASASETPNYKILTLQNGQATFSLLELVASSNTWTQTSQADFEGGTLNQLDTTTSPGDVILDTFTDNVTDSYDDQTMIASSANITVSGGQVKLSYASGSSATETLRPNATGDETGISEQYPATGANWDKVDEATSDDDTTYIQNNGGWQEDLYNTGNHVTGSGIINYVKVYMVNRALDTPTRTGAYVHIKTNGVEYNGPEELLTTSYATYSNQWTNNPQTGSAWTWDEIDALQIGVGIRGSKAGGSPSTRYTRSTQVYVEVNYTDISYNSLGTLTSVNLLSGETVISIDSFYYDASAIPSGTSLKVQYSQDNSNWYNSAGTSDGWDTLAQGTNSVDLSGLSWSGANFYYNMEFTSDGGDTPILDEISAVFSTYYAAGDLTSSSNDAGSDAAWDWQNITFTLTEPSTTDIKFQLRSATTEGGLSVATWYGPTGTGDYYTTSGALINSVHDGDRWIQYKAYFSGPSDYTPTFSDISISYTAAASTYTVEIIGGGYCLISDNSSEWGSGWSVTPEFYSEITQR